MATRKTKALMPVMATLLALALAFSGWALLGRLDFEARIANLEKDFENPQGHPKQLQLLNSINPEDLSDRQAKRWRKLLDRGARPQLFRDLTLKTMQGDRESTMSLSDALSPGVFVAQRRFEVGFRLTEGSVLEDYLGHIHLGEQTLEPMKTRDAAEFEIPEGMNAEILPLQIESQLGGFLGGEQDLQLVITFDDEMPQFALSAETGTLNSVGGIHDLEGVRSLQLLFRDKHMLRSAAYRWTGGDWLSIESYALMEATATITVGLEIGKSTELEFKAEDLAGNVLQGTHTIRRLAKKPLEISQLSISRHRKAGDLKLATFSENLVPLTLKLSGKDGAYSVHARIATHENPIAFAYDGSTASWSAQIPTSGKADDFSVDLVVDNEEREYLVKRLALRRDLKSPQILISRGGEDLLDIPEILCALGDEFVLSVRDESPLVRDALTLSWNGDLQPLDAGAYDAAGVYRRRFRMSGEADAQLSISARDLHGRESSRRLDFRIPREIPPNDNQGPNLSLQVGDLALSDKGENVLWQSGAEVSLRISDDSGVRESDLKLTGAELAASLSERFQAQLQMSLRHRSGPIVVEIKDRFGNQSRNTFRITRIDTKAELRGPAIDPKTNTLNLGELPARFRVAMKQVPPEGHLRAYLENRDDRSLRIPVALQGLNAIIESGDKISGSQWRLLVVLKALDGDHTIAEINTAQ